MKDEKKEFTTKDKLYWIGQGLYLNLGAIITYFFMCLTIRAWLLLFNLIRTLDKDIVPLATIVWIVVICITMRMPQIISGGVYDLFDHINK